MKHSRFIFSSRFLTLVFVLTLTVPVLATDGYFSLAYGTRSKGMGGAGVALAGNSLFGVSNPAGNVRLGTSYGVALGLFSPDRSYTVTGAPTMPMPGMFPPPFGLAEGKVTSENKLFPMPSFAANFMLDEVSSLAVSLYGNGGMNTEYNAKTYYAQYLDGPVMPGGMNPMEGVTSPTGVNLMQMFGAITYSRALSEKWSMGVAAIAAVQSFKATGLQAFANFGMSENPGGLTNNDQPFAGGIGGKIGVLGQLTKCLSFGATFQTPIVMGQFQRYTGLFAEQGKFNVPATWNAGLAWQPNEKFVVAFDVKQIFYSSVKSIGNPMNIQALMPYMMGETGLVPNPSYVGLGNDEGSGFGWKDMLIFKIGAEYKVAPNSVVRVGFSHGNNPVPESEVMFNILAPGIVENHITAGFTQHFGNKALDFAFVYALNKKLTGPNPMDPAQTIELQMSQMEFEIGFRF